MRKIYWGFFLLLTFIVTLPITWWLMVKVDFAYPFLYEQLNINQHISRYAPQNNKGKLGFERTTKAKRLGLFHGVVIAIENKGQGLQKLSYSSGNSGVKAKQETVLFTPAEIIHLKDVANLLDKLKPIVASLVVAWLTLVAIILLRKVKLPSIKQWLMSAFMIMALLTGILALGPEKVFNQLHVWIFPNNHQWFFYYEESLMSTMMKAPDLFAYIAGFWGLISLLLSMFIIVFLTKLRSKPSA